MTKSSGERFEDSLLFVLLVLFSCAVFASDTPPSSTSHMEASPANSTPPSSTSHMRSKPHLPTPKGVALCFVDFPIGDQYEYPAGVTGGSWAELGGRVGMIERSLAPSEGARSGAPRRGSRQVWLFALFGAAAVCLLIYRSLESRRAVREHAVQERAAPHQRTVLTRPAILARTGPIGSTAVLEQPPPVIVEQAVSAEAAAEQPEPEPQDYVDQARAEPRDDAWADAMERTFGEDLKAKGKELDFRVGQVECFQASCTAELFWNSLREARADFKAALGEPDHTHCSPRLSLSKTGNEASPEMGVMVLDCKTARERAAMRAGTTHPD